jgi:shikimate dehydrogenase
MSADPILSFGDLEGWSRPDTSLGVVGFPIGQSLSPEMHNAALTFLAGEDRRYDLWRYFRFEIRPSELPAALKLFHARGFLGINLTIPHKLAGFKLVESADEASRAVGAVNTLARTPAGWRGFNTDGHGMAAAVRETLGRELTGATVLIVGAGGAARSAAAECLSRGCSALWIANRTPATLDSLLAVIRPLAGRIPVRGLSPEDLPHGLPAGSLVINATNAGLRPGDGAPVDLARLPRPAGVYDVIYNPPVTRLLRDAEALGLPRANGVSMLVHQGAKALEIWTGVPAARTAPVMEAAVRSATLR